MYAPYVVIMIHSRTCLPRFVIATITVLVVHVLSVHGACRWLEAPLKCLDEIEEGVRDAVEDLAFIEARKSCTPFYNTYFHTSGESGGISIVDASENLKLSSRECCDSCTQQEGCNAWHWCPVEIGCHFRDTGNSSTDSIRIPYLGCQLLQIDDFSGYTRDIKDIRTTGEGIPLIAGSPVSVVVNDVMGYVSFPGTEVGGVFDFQCNFSVLSTINGSDDEVTLLQSNTADMKNDTDTIPFDSSSEFGCVIKGSVDQVATICSLSALCKGFTYYNQGFGGTSLKDIPFYGSPFGVLKSKKLQEEFITSMDINPHSITYMDSEIIPEVL